MKIRSQTTLIILIWLLSYKVILGQGESGAQFLKIGVGAKACALGEAFVGIANDPTTIYWNPAGLTQLDNIEILATYNFWLLDMSYQNISASFKTSFGSLGVAVGYSSSGNISKFENFQKTGEYNAYDAVVNIGYALDFNRLSLGIGVKYIHQKIEDYNASGFAVDFGLLYKLSEETILRNLQLGFAVQNLGPKIKFIEKAEALPLNFKFGTSYKIGSFLFALDANKPIDNKFRVNGGCEFEFNNIVFLRAGYNTANSYSAGFGVQWNIFTVDYSFTPYKEINDSHRIAVKLNL